MTNPPESVHEIANSIASSVREQTSDISSSRRTFISRSARAGGGVLALGGSGLTLAQEDDDGGGDDDVDILNFALTLELLEEAFYDEVLNEFDVDDYLDSASSDENQEMAARELYELVEDVGEHESEHVDVLTQTIETLDGDPVSEAEYDFGIDSVRDVVETAQTLENTGVAAYAGAAPDIENSDVLSAALSIHSVEARHAAFFNALNKESPFPDAFDPALDQDEVLDILDEFIVSDSDDDDDEDT